MLTINSPHPTMSWSFGILPSVKSSFGGAVLICIWAGKRRLSQMNGHDFHFKQCHRLHKGTIWQATWFSPSPPLWRDLPWSAVSSYRVYVHVFWIRWSLKLLPTQTILYFYDSMIQWFYDSNILGAKKKLKALHRGWNNQSLLFEEAAEMKQIAWPK